jgi:hypothetical protein
MIKYYWSGRYSVIVQIDKYNIIDFNDVKVEFQPEWVDELRYVGDVFNVLLNDIKKLGVHVSDCKLISDGRLMIGCRIRHEYWFTLTLLSDNVTVYSYGNYFKVKYCDYDGFDWLFGFLGSVNRAGFPGNSSLPASSSH